MSTETQVRIIQRIIQEVIKEKAKHLPKEKKKHDDEKSPIELSLPPPKPVAPQRSIPLPKPKPQVAQGMQPSRFPRTRGSLGRAIINRSQQPPPQTAPQAPQVGLEKLSPLLEDPSVQALECSGPGQALTVHRSGVKQKANMSLSGEEINELLQTFSEKTNMPLNQGVFKATLGKLTLTAVVSEFVGTRFVLSKAN
jgi:hypothetical protein